MNLTLTSPVTGAMLTEEEKNVPLTHTEIADLINTWRRKGWDIRSIVALKSDQEWHERDQSRWGVIDRTVYHSGEKFLECKFVGKAEVKCYSPEELVLVHKAISYDELTRQMKELNS